MHNKVCPQCNKLKLITDFKQLSNEKYTKTCKHCLELQMWKRRSYRDRIGGHKV